MGRRRSCCVAQPQPEAQPEYYEDPIVAAALDKRLKPLEERFGKVAGYIERTEGLQAQQQTALRAQEDHAQQIRWALSNEFPGEFTIDPQDDQKIVELGKWGEQNGVWAQYGGPTVQAYVVARYRRGQAAPVANGAPTSPALSKIDELRQQTAAASNAAAQQLARSLAPGGNSLSPPAPAVQTGLRVGTRRADGERKDPKEMAKDMFAAFDHALGAG